MLVLFALMIGTLSGDPAFEEGRQLYDQLEYEQAVFRFQEVALRPELSAEDKATALIWLGLSYAGAGSLETAKLSFADAARTWPDVVLPIEVSPALQQLFVEATQATAAPPPPPPPPPTPTPAPGPAFDEALVLPAVGIAAGVAVVAAGAGLAALSAVTFAGAQDKQLFQAEAQAQGDTANLELGLAYLLIPTGLAVAAGATWLLIEAGGP